MANVFLFTGENLFALRKEKNRWTAEFAQKHGAENLLSVDGQSLSLQKILDEVSAAPFIAEKRLTVINGVPKFSKEEMRRLLDALHPANILLFADPAPDKRLGGLKELMTEATVKEFAPLTGKPLSDWIVAFAHECGSSITADAAAALVGIVGEDQETLSNELRKLAIGAGSSIAADHVRALAVPSGDQEVWGLTNLLARGDLAATLSYVRTLLRSGEDPFSLWNMLLWMTRSLAATVICAAEGEKNPAKIASAAGVPFPTAKTFLPLAQHISLAQLRALIAWTVDADRELKTGGYRATGEASQELLALIDELVMRCCAQRA